MILDGWVFELIKAGVLLYEMLLDLLDAASVPTFLDISVFSWSKSERRPIEMYLRVKSFIYEELSSVINLWISTTRVFIIEEPKIISL